MEHIIDHADEFVGRRYAEAKPEFERYDWSSHWPIVTEIDGSLKIVGLYDSDDDEASDEIVIADVEDGRVVRVGEGCAADVAVYADEYPEAQ